MTLSVTALQIIAVVTMTIDHIGCLFFPQVILFRCIGRWAFVIYAFLMAEGFRHTSQSDIRLQKQLTFLVLVTLATELIFDGFSMPLRAPGAHFFTAQSSLVTLTLGYITLAVFKRVQTKKPLAVAVVLIACVMAYVSRGEYGPIGLLLIVGFYGYLTYALQKDFPIRRFFLAAILFVYLSAKHVWQYRLNSFSVFTPNLAATYVGIWTAAVPLALYTGERGIRSMGWKWVFRLYYPAHMLLLILLREVLA